jgi:hypothetical protein
MSGFIVPTTAMTRSGQNSVTATKPTPVATINTAAVKSSRRREYRLAIQPTHRVIRAVPTSVPVTMVPTASALKPRSTR